MSTLAVRKVPDMLRKDIVGEYKKAILNYYNGDVRKIFYTDIQTPMPANKKIVSLTDTTGIITNANSAFMDMSGYSRAELLGVPHSILRHPDMPRAAFVDMWEKLSATGSWQGYVKNLRKDGGFYWVFAKVFTLTRNQKLVGYTSSRIAAPVDKIKEYSALYAKMLREEQSSSL